MTSNAISSSLDHQQGLIQQNSAIKYQQGPIRENSGIIVDRDKQRTGPAQYKRCRFADDQIVNSDQQQRARRSRPSRHRHNSSVPDSGNGSGYPNEFQQNPNQVPLTRRAASTSSLNHEYYDQRPQHPQLQQQQPQRIPQQLQYQQQQQYYDGNGAQPYYPNDYQSHPVATLQQGRRTGPPMPMPGYDPLDYPVDDRSGRAIVRTNGQQEFDPRQPDMYQQGYPVYDQQQVMYQRNGFEQHPEVYQNEVLDYRQIPGSQMTNIQGSGRLRRTLPGTQGLDQRQPIMNHRTLNGSPSLNQRQSSFNHGLEQRQPSLYHRTLSGSIASRRQNPFSSSHCRFVPPEIYQKAVQLQRCHPEQQSSVSIIKPFYSELEILEDTLPQPDSSSNWDQTASDWNHQTQLNSMEHKCVTTLQYTHVHPTLQAHQLQQQQQQLQIQQQQQQLQLQQPLLNPLVHIPHTAFKPQSDRILIGPERDVVRFRAPLKIENVEDILQRTIAGMGEPLRIHQNPIFKPTGGTLYLQVNAIPSLNSCDDGYNWTEVLHQETLATPKGYILDFRHYYVTSPRGWRMSSRFRKEAYTIGNLTLVALSGDEREAQALGNDDEEIPSLNFNSNSWPRSRKNDNRLSRSLEEDSIDLFGEWDERNSRSLNRDRRQILALAHNRRPISPDLDSFDLQEMGRRTSRSMERTRRSLHGLGSRLSRSLERTRYDPQRMYQRTSRSLERPIYDLHRMNKRASRSLERLNFDLEELEQIGPLNLRSNRFAMSGLENRRLPQLQLTRFDLQGLDSRISRPLERTKLNIQGLDRRISRSLERTKFGLKGLNKRASRSLERARLDLTGFERGNSRSLDRARFELRESSLTRPIRPRPISRLTRSAELEMSSLELSSVESCNPDPDPKIAGQDWYNELISVVRELSGGKLVKNLSVYPTLQVTLVHPDMTREFEHACQVLTSENVDREGDIGIRLFYDMTIPIGSRFNATLLTYSNACFEGSPVLPLAINLHESRFKSCHQLFWARVVGDIPALQKHRFPLFIDDAEPAVHLAVRMQAPNLVQLEGWVHRFRDINSVMRAKGYGKDAIKYFKACVSYLLTAKSKQAMHDKFRTEFEFIWPKDFVQYYREKLLPRSGRLGQWALSKVNVHELHFQNANANPQESFYQTCRHFVGWHQLTLAQLLRAFDLLFNYYVGELQKGLSIHRDGLFLIKDVFRPFFYEITTSNPSKVMHPSKICLYVQEYFPPRKTEPIPEPVMPDVPFEDDFVVPNRVHFTNEDTDSLDIEKALEKVFAENDKQKMEKKNQYQLDLENSLAGGETQLVLEQNFSMLSINQITTVPQSIPPMPLSLQTLAQSELEYAQTNGAQTNQNEVSTEKEANNQNTTPPINTDYSNYFQDSTKSRNETSYLPEITIKPQSSFNSQDDPNDSGDQMSNNYSQQAIDCDTRSSIDQEISIGELGPFNSQPESDYSDSGNEDLVTICYPDSPQESPGPERPHTLLLTTRISNSEALYNYNQNAPPAESQNQHAAHQTACYNQTEEMEDLMDTFSKAHSQAEHGTGLVGTTSAALKGSFQTSSVTVQSNIKESAINCHSNGKYSHHNMGNDSASLMTESAVALTLSQTTTTTATATTLQSTSVQGASARQHSGFVNWNSSVSDPANLMVNKGGLMLWKKVQNYVVVCGGMVNASSVLNQGDTSGSRSSTMSTTSFPRLQQNQQQQQQQQQHQQHPLQYQKKSIEYEYDPDDYEQK